MAADRWISFAILAILALPSALPAAELPSQNEKPKLPKAVKHCNVAGSPGIQAANGVCVKLSGYISSEFTAGRLK
jgi:hypothetical protein